MKDESSAGGEGGAVPRPPDDWSDWVSASKLRGYLVKNTLGDWLDLYGRDHGFVRDSLRDDYDERLDFLRFRTERGIAFEKAVVAWLADRAELIRVGGTARDSRDLKKAKETLAALKDEREIVHQAVLWNPEDRTYGSPDFLIRSDVFDRLFPEHLDPGEAELPAPGLDRPWHYLVVDAKFATLTLKTRLKEVRQSDSTRAYKGQLHVYNAALGRLQGHAPPRAFLLGRGYKHEFRRDKQDLQIVGSSAVERLGHVPMDEGLRKQAAKATGWIRRLRREGADWSPLPEPSVSELQAPRGSALRNTAPWAHAIKVIARQQRNFAKDAGSRSSESAAWPGRIKAGEKDWRELQPLEFFVDFEDVQDVDDDFSRFPEKGGQAMIFMIGCGHLEDGEWNFHCFIADRLDLPSEERIITDWLEHMKTVRERLGSPESDPKVFHWANAETSRFGAAVKRHPGNAWVEPGWFDLYDKVVEAEPFVVPGTSGFGLKEVANGLYHHGKIRTSWENSPVDGQGAMVGAWRCDRDVAEKGIRLEETALMQEIRKYNQVDCRVMQEILDYLRKNH